jgi:hypothetical protein
MMWPRKKAKGKVEEQHPVLVPIDDLFSRMEEQLVQLEKEDKRPIRCPTKFQISGACVCMTCSKKGTCSMEDSCRKSECENFIRACSFKHKLEKNNGTVSEFSKNISKMLVQEILGNFTNEERDKYMKALLEREREKKKEEEKNAKEERITEPFDRERPSGCM